MTVTFEGYERRADKINKCLADNGIASLEEALQICTDKGFNPREIVNNTQSIAFQNAEWAYTLGWPVTSPSLPLRVLSAWL